MKYEKHLSDEKIECTICPRKCKLKKGQRGFCYVRRNSGTEIELTTYGETTGLAIDPIEKKPLFHFYPGSQVLSLGTLGCNMGCLFCQNWHISKREGKISNNNDFDKNFCAASPDKIAKIATLNDCKSIAFTYNDPIIFFEYAIDIAKAAHERNLNTVAVTSGYMNELPRKEFFKYMDTANIDLKGFSEKFYSKNCLAHIQPVLETIKYVGQETDCWLELTTLLIEGENDNEDELQRMCEWILKNVGANVPLHFSAFHRAYRFMKSPPTTIKTLIKAYNIARQTGINYVYTGNIINPDTEATYCKRCGSVLIERFAYRIFYKNLTNKDGNPICGLCGTELNGRF